MRENPDGFPSSPGAARAAAPIPVIDKSCLRLFLQATLGDEEGKVMAGETPANPAALLKSAVGQHYKQLVCAEAVLPAIQGAAQPAGRLWIAALPRQRTLEAV